MMSKRKYSDDEKNNTRKFPNLEFKNSKSFKIEIKNVSLPTDTEAAAQYLKNNFLVDAFNKTLPLLLLHHQLYTLIKDVSKVDLEVKRLNEEHKICQFVLSREHSCIVLIFMDDLKEHIHNCCGDDDLINKFFNRILLQVPGIGIDKNQLYKLLKTNEKGASELMNKGLLVSSDSDTYHFSFPNAGLFMKHLLLGRKSLIKIISKNKYGEILQSELEKRKLEKKAKLGMKFHIHDAIGSKLVFCTQTTSGTLLRAAK